MTGRPEQGLICMNEFYFNGQRNKEGHPVDKVIVTI